jgi:replicative DNA helicase
VNDHEPPPAEPSDEPRWSLIAEQSVLGGLMLPGAPVEDVLDAVAPADFYEPKHEHIALAIGALIRRGSPVDPITVTEELRRHEVLEKAGGAAYLHELTSVVPTAANAGYYAQAVRETAELRRLVVAGTRITQMGHATEGTVEQFLDRAWIELQQVSTGGQARVHKIGDTFLELVDSLEEKPIYFSSPWESLDKLIGGFAPGALYVVAARPGSGKSIVALQAAAHLAHEGVVAFSSLEMTEAELQKRLIAQYGPVHMTSLRNHTLNSLERQLVGEAVSKVRNAPIFVDERPGLSVSQIRAHARAVSRSGKLVAVVVDYLQLVHGEGQSRQEAVAQVSRDLKQLAKDLNVPVIAAAQLRRSSERGHGRKLPGLDDLRESGAIEQDADVVILLDRDKEKNPNDLTVIVAKNRHGEMGKFTLAWQAQFARVRDKSWSPTALIEESEL